MEMSAAVEPMRELSRPSKARQANRRTPMARNCEGDLLEIEQHASIPRLTHGFELERRDFFKLLGAGILICIASSAPAQESGHHGGGPEQDVSKSIDAW